MLRLASFRHINDPMALLKEDIFSYIQSCFYRVVRQLIQLINPTVLIIWRLNGNGKNHYYAQSTIGLVQTVLHHAGM